MRPPSLVVLLSCSVLASCGTQTPSSPTVLPRYVLDVTASPSCAQRWVGSFFIGQFRFQVVLANAGAETLFQLPTSPQLSGANSGSLALRLRQEVIGVTGELSGSGLTDEGTHLAAFSSADATGAATVTGTGTIGVTPVSGLLNGKITWSVYRSSAAGECTAADHQWQLTAG